MRNLFAFGWAAFLPILMFANSNNVSSTSELYTYQFLLEKTKEVSSKVDADKAVYYSVKIRENDIWDSSIYQKHQQI